MSLSLRHTDSLKQLSLAAAAVKLLTSSLSPLKEKPCAHKLLVIPCLCVQVESALAVQKLKPTIDAIKRQYGDDKNSIQRETSALYEASGVNPAAGELCTNVQHSLQLPKSVSSGWKTADLPLRKTPNIYIS